MIDKVKTIIKLETDEPDIYIKYFAKDESIREESFDWGELEEYINNLEDRIDKAIEFIYENAYDEEREICIDDLWGEIPKLLDILKGSDKE